MIPTRSIIPAAAHVLIQVKDGKLKLTTTDIHHKAGHRFPVEEAEPGECLVPARKLLGFVKALNTQEINAELIGTTLHLATENIHFDIPGIPVAEFPQFPVEAGQEFKVNQDDLRRALRMTIFAMAEEETRLSLTGCYFHFEGDTARLVATDNRRLALAEFRPTVPPPDPTKVAFILPGNAARFLLSSLTHAYEVNCLVNERRATFSYATPEGAEFEMSFILLEEKFPNYTRFVQPLLQESRIAREAFLQALKRACIVLDDKDGSITLHFKENSLQLQARAQAHLEEVIPMNHSNNDIVAAFKPQLLAEALEVIPDPEVVFNLQGPQAPLLFRSRDFFYIAMPRRT